MLYKPNKYKILMLSRTESARFEVEVNRLLDDGWYFHGDTILNGETPNDNARLFQAFVKYEDPFDKSVV